MKAPKFNSFFSGIGGFDLALERNGFSPALQCEIDPFCRAVLQAHWPNIPIQKDITQLTPEQIPPADIWCGGFPCQDVSVARGSKGREGLKGKNSGLFFPFAELISKAKPRVILIENVVGLLSSHNGQDFRIIIEHLADLGYVVVWRVMNARYFGSPQSRPRVFVCAAMGEIEIALNALYERGAGTFPKHQRAGFISKTHCPESGAIVPQVAYCLAATSGRHTGTDWSRTYVSYRNAVRRLTPNECEGLQGFPPGWTDVGFKYINGDNDVDSPRYKALGNAVAVPIVEWIANRIKADLGVERKRYLRNKGELLQKLVNYQDFRNRSIREMNLSDLHLATKANGDKLRWQSGGIAVDDFCWDIKAPEGPAEPIENNLIAVIEKQRPSPRYFLSSNAATGILRRVRSQNRTLFGPMHDALVRMSTEAGKK